MPYDIPQIVDLELKIARGLLPHHAPPVVIWAGPGQGGLCSACNTPVAAPEVEYEIPEPQRDGTPFRFHIRCYEVWKSFSTSRQPK